MRTSYVCFILLFMFMGCKQEASLTFEPLVFTENECASCPKVHISIPKALERSKLATTINTALREEIISLLLFDDELEATTIAEAITSFTNGYTEIKDLYPDEPAQWEAKIDAKTVYEDANLLTIELNSYQFTGGAHGYGSKRFLNFDKEKGIELENWQLFNNQEDFQNYVETKFRSKENIPQGKPINSTGFMFEKDSFYLPENIGFTKEGIKLLYNQYEVASYADGPIELTLPYKDVKKYLAKKTKS